MISNNPYRTIGVDNISKYLCEIFRVAIMNLDVDILYNYKDLIRKI